MRILVPTDLSENADNALGFAKELIRQNGGEITLLFTYYAVYDFAAQATRIVGQIEKDAKKALKKIIKKNGDPSIVMDYRIVQGTVETAVDAASKKLNIDLIIMGTQGASGLKKVLLGSNTADVIKEVDVPVLAVPSGSTYEQVKKVVVAVELKKEDPTTIHTLMDLTAEWRLPIEILYINKDNNFDSESGFKGLKKYLTENFPLVEAAYTSYKAEGINEGLQEYLKDHPDCLLVMFSKTKSFFEQLFEKSHSVEMAYHTHVPLLVVKTR